VDLTFAISSFHRFCLLLGMVWCTPEPGDVVERMMFEKCVPAMEYNTPLETGDLYKMPEDYASNVEEKSGGNSWIDIVHGVEIYAMRTHYQGRDFTACQVRQHEPKYAMSDLEPIYDRWAENQISLGRYIEIPVCADETEDYYRIFESSFRNPNGNHVRVAIWNMQELDFVFMAAGENHETFAGCEE